MAAEIPPKIPHRQVRHASIADLNYIVDLHSKNSKCLGFIPEAGMKVYIEQGKVLLANLNSESAGYLLMQPNGRDAPGIATIHQACVQYDVRHREVGLEMVRRARLQCRAHGAGIIQLWCRCDLEANAFWLAAGFKACALKKGGDQRGMPLVGWRTQLIAGADIMHPASNRSRSEAGAPIMLTENDLRVAVTEAIVNGQTENVEAAWLKVSGSKSKKIGKFTSADVHHVSADVTGTASADVTERSFGT